MLGELSFVERRGYVVFDNVPSGMGLYLVLLFYGTVLAHKLNALLTTAALAAF